ncbi:MAG: toxic anion resistance protein [Candidatus Nanopelagicales bacterium]|nr:toxic anion resistance protein [Candidatus Nanopelagicales bacterium]
MTNTAATASPEPTEATLTLTPPEPVAAVQPNKAAGMVPLDPAVLPGLDQLVVDFATALTAVDTKSPEFSRRADQIRSMGDADIRKASSVSSRLLEKSANDMRRSVGEGANVPRTLLELRRTVEDLDPSEATGTRKLLGFIPFGDKITDYFRRYESSQSHLNAILQSLYDGQDELRRDNADLEQEKANLWATMQRLQQYIYVAERLDATVARTVEQSAASDPVRSKAIEQDVLFYVRQKHQDLLTQLAVAVQAYLAIDLIKKNNIELIKGVDRATTTTLSALRTAVIVAQALANQKLVLDQITALNTTTSGLIESTSRLLADQSASIQQQAASATIGIDQLRTAFANIYQAMDAIDSFKSASLASMSQTIDVLASEVAKSQEYVARARRGAEEVDIPGGAAADNLDLPAAPA